MRINSNDPVALYQVNKPVQSEDARQAQEELPQVTEKQNEGAYTVELSDEAVKSSAETLNTQRESIVAKTASSPDEQENARRMVNLIA
ncbi:MAG: hypothetical protein B6I31_04190 [Desulfobacteraceae bacterium 4572_19]|nr:MAG: hypothetical protein B6I31_04190 [Desulfobacteraceae bacterium 4572_19]